MAAKFVIIKVDAKIFGDMFQWKLLDKDGKKIMRNIDGFLSEKEARENIAKVKKAITRYTKVEVENNE